jgi:hypothetical protein
MRRPNQRYDTLLQLSVCNSVESRRNALVRHKSRKLKHRVRQNGLPQIFHANTTFQCYLGKMLLTAAYSWFRFLMAALIALAFVAGPLAEDAHAAERSTICYVDHTADTATPEDSDPSGGHEHAVHNCGACHHHVWSANEGLTFDLVTTSPRFSLKPDNAVLKAPPYELLRPPRA